MPPTIIELASSITKSTAIYHDYLAQKNLPLPAHDVTPLQQRAESNTLPQEIAAALDAAIEASYELHQLLVGPVGCVVGAAAEVNPILFTSARAS